MKKYISILKRSKLFSGVGENDITLMLTCLGAVSKSYPKGEYVFRQGEHISNICILVEGKLHIQRDDYWGNRSIINIVETGEMFGESYASPGSGPMTNDVIAAESCTVIFFDVSRILTTCSSSCRFHTLTVQNLFFALSERNKQLMSKLIITSQRTTREKLIAYLSEQAKKHDKSTFEIPFNRQQLADYLSVDRSAMSSELSKLRDEELIEFNKNKFTLL